MSESFRGNYEHGIDEKGRIVVPQKFRGELGEKFVLTRGTDKEILLCPEKYFNRLEKALKKKSLNDPLRLFLLSGCGEASVDKQGRIVIPPNLRKHAELTKECVYTGSIEFVQLWDKARYEGHLAAIDTQDLGERMADLSLDDDEEE